MAIKKVVRREPGRDEKILSDHRQDGNDEIHRLQEKKIRCPTRALRGVVARASPLTNLPFPSVFPCTTALHLAMLVTCRRVFFELLEVPQEKHVVASGSPVSLRVWGTATSAASSVVDVDDVQILVQVSWRDRNVSGAMSCFTLRGDFAVNRRVRQRCR